MISIVRKYAGTICSQTKAKNHEERKITEFGNDQYYDNGFKKRILTKEPKVIDEVKYL